MAWSYSSLGVPLERSRARRAAAMAVPCIVILLLGFVVFHNFSSLWPNHHRHHPGYSSSSDLDLRSRLEAHRTAFHFQPVKNWMNDPNGPMFYKGYYHIFYQWNPFAAVWGNMTWGHAVSKDLIHWMHLEPALFPDAWYDLYGCFTGSATFVEGHPILVYTGWSNISANMNSQVQLQAIAVPADSNDTLLRKWVKIPENPVLKPPVGIAGGMFRDPTTAWLGADGKWRLVVGAESNGTGLALLYKSSDFIHWEKEHSPLHSVPSTGMWECPDFYPVSMSANNRSGVDTSANGPNLMHVLKVSFRHDYYAVGAYFPNNDSFLPALPNLDAGIGPRHDYGKYYASKSFYDDNKGRRIIFGWVDEADAESTDVVKGWASVQAIPRMVWLDPDTNHSLLQWPIEEVDLLHEGNVTLKDAPLDSGSVMEVKGMNGMQLDIDVAFKLPDLKQAQKEAENVTINTENAQSLCSQKGITRSGIIGPFGVLVLASNDQIEQTAVFFVVIFSKDGWKALICHDQSRSSLAMDVDKTSFGSFVSIPTTETSLSLRTLVDHSIVETFAQGGKVCVTSRSYPTKAINNEATLFVFNNGTATIQLRQLTAWKMASVEMTAM